MAEVARKQGSRSRSRKVSGAAGAEVKELETLKGTVSRKRFHNAANGYCVLVCEVESLKDSADFEGGSTVMVGSMPAVREGDEYSFKGVWVNDEKWGKQFKFAESELILPSGKAGVARYLSQCTYGVGIKRAEKIVQALGDDALERIKTDPGVLNCEALSFLDERQRGDIVNDLAANGIQAELASIVCVPGNGVGMGTVAKIMARYGGDAVKVVKENPYLLSDDLFGVGFRKADTIGLAAGVEANSGFRVEAALDYILKEAGNEGHVYLEPRDIVGRLLGRNERGKRVKGLLDGSGVQAVPDIRDANLRLVSNGKCVRDGDSVYSRGLYEAEVVVAGCVRRLVSLKVAEIYGVRLDEMISSIEMRDGIEHAEHQKEAIKAALLSSLSVITGGPGVGKTRTLLTVCDIYSKLYPRHEIYLAAPTGRAAKRMAEATGREAKTIHRLLAYNPSIGGFEYGANNQLEGPGLMIVDEASMIDIELASSLLSAVGDDIQVVLVGDVDQLPSVGPGSVLRDIIASGKVPTVRLQFNYRQAGGSKVSEYANLICQGVVPTLKSVGDFEFYGVEDAEEARDKVLRLVKDLVAEGVGLLGWQCLAPMRRGSCGVTALNEAIREIVNPAVVDNGDGREGKATLGSYRVGDKIMIIANNYGLDVFNGDIGIIKDIVGGKMMIDFGDSLKVLTVEDLGILTLSYASTIHKSQGSEYGIVIMPLVRQHYMMLQRNLAYTGITRAKNRLILVGDEKAVKQAVGNAVIERRNSKLAERIRGEG